MIATVVGPSGAGKDTLIRAALRQRPGLRVVRRVITRPAEAGGEDFESVTGAEFAARKAAGEFALDWEAHGLRYGIPAAQLTGSGPILFNGSRAALPAALAAIPGLCVILVTAPPDVLARRLAARGREQGADLAERLARGDDALPPGIDAVTVMNDATPAEGAARLLAALDASAQRQDRP